MKNSASCMFLTVLCLSRVSRAPCLSLTCFVFYFWFLYHDLHCKNFAVFGGQMGTVPILDCALWDRVVNIATLACSPYFVLKKKKKKKNKLLGLNLPKKTKFSF